MVCLLNRFCYFRIGTRTERDAQTSAGDLRGTGSADAGDPIVPDGDVLQAGVDAAEWAGCRGPPSRWQPTAPPNNGSRWSGEVRGPITAELN